MVFEYFERPGLTLTERILKLIPNNPQILDMENPRDLFDIEGFYCNDLHPDWYQAAWAFDRAKMLYRERRLRPNRFLDEGEMQRWFDSHYPEVIGEWKCAGLYKYVNFWDFIKGSHRNELVEFKDWFRRNRM